MFVFALLCFFLPHTVAAQSPEQIERYDTQIIISQDGAIHVTERIFYMFPSPRHGILREIPMVKTNEDGKKYKLTINDIRVADDQGKNYQLQESQDGDNLVLKIGDPDKTITGEHWYVISYTVLGALTYFPGHDELYWNAVGTGWQVPISGAQMSVVLPQSVASSDLNAKCFVGAQGATGENCAISYRDNSVLFHVSQQLNPYEGATVVVGFPKGIVAKLEPTQIVPFFETLAGKVTLILLGILTFIWYIVTPIFVVRRWLKSGRDPKPAMGEVSAWFSPPKTKKLRSLTPAETGTLIDESADLRDVYATIVDLARRGYMQIIETKKKGMLGASEEFAFAKKKDWKGNSDIQPFEEELLSEIFKKKDNVHLKDLDLHETFEKVKKEVYESLVLEDFFPENPEKVRTIYYGLAGVAFVTGNLILFLVAFIFGKYMPRKTLFGAEQAAVARSLKNFLVSQDKQLEFQAKKQMMFEKLLPYAIAFGVEEIWAARFKDLALKQPDWYTSPGGAAFNSVLFAHSLGRVASASFASSITSKSSSGFSSGFSGGSSGGGGGGGGGGSW